MGLRVLGIAFPEFSRPDDELGWAPIPGVEGTYAVEGRTFLRINAEGFRDEEQALAKPEATLRIAVLGDSFTEAREVPLEETYWKVMERRLADCAISQERGVEVLNFGVNGYGTAQEYLVLEAHVWKYRPDIVLLAVFTGNDVWNNSRALDGHEHRPYFVLSDGALMLDDSNLRSTAFRMAKLWADAKRAAFNRLRTFQVIYQAYRNTKSRAKYHRLDLFDQLNASLEPGVYRPPSDQRWRSAWQVSEALIAQIGARVAERGSVLWLVTLTNPIQVYPDAALRERMVEQLGVEHLEYPDRRIAGVAAASGIPHVMLVAPLRAYAEAEAVSLHGTAAFAGGHWNATGHRIAGEVLAERLCAAYGPS